MSGIQAHRFPRVRGARTRHDLFECVQDRHPALDRATPLLGALDSEALGGDLRDGSRPRTVSLRGVRP